jgi:UDP-N-acetylmuramate-alanine ligase
MAIKKYLSPKTYAMMTDVIDDFCKQECEQDGNSCMGCPVYDLADYINLLDDVDTVKTKRPAKVAVKAPAKQKALPAKSVVSVKPKAVVLDLSAGQVQTLVIHADADVLYRVPVGG